MSKLKVDEIRSADRSVSSSANITLADDGNVSLGGTLSAGTIGTGVTQPPRHNFLAYLTSDQTINNGSRDLVAFNADEYSSWDSSTSKGFDTTNHYYVVPETGYYWIYFSGRLTDGSDTGGGSIWKLSHNEVLSGSSGTPSRKNFGIIIKEASGYIASGHNGMVLNLTVGDILRLYCANSIGSQEAIQATTDGFTCTVMGGFILR